MTRTQAGNEVTFELASATGERCRLRLVLHTVGTVEVVEGPVELRRRWTGEDWFAATCELRRRAERVGLRALIAGAEADVWPTLGQRDAGGLALTRLGRRADERCVLEVVDLFEPAPVERVVGIAEQFHRWRDWLQRPAPAPGPREAEILAELAPTGEHICVDTPADDPRLEFVGTTLGWWRVDGRTRFEPQFRYNPRLVRVARRSGRKCVAEVLFEAEPQQVRLRLLGAGIVDAVGRGPDGFVALADLREHAASHGRRLCVQGAVEQMWRRTDDGLTVALGILGRTPRGGRNRDLLDPADLDDIASVEDQRRYRQMLHASYWVPNEEELAWARREPESWQPKTMQGDARHGPRIMGWWRSDAWGRVVEFRPNPAVWKLAPPGGVEALLSDCEVPTDLYPLDGW